MSGRCHRSFCSSPLQPGNLPQSPFPLRHSESDPSSQSYVKPMLPDLGGCLFNLWTSEVSSVHPVHVDFNLCCIRTYHAVLFYTFYLLYFISESVFHSVGKIVSDVKIIHAIFILLVSTHIYFSVNFLNLWMISFSLNKTSTLAFSNFLLISLTTPLS